MFCALKGPDVFQAMASLLPAETVERYDRFRSAANLGQSGQRPDV
jgi:hypothetical protein